MTILTILLNTIYATNLNIFSICFYFCQITPLIFRLQIISVRGGILLVSSTIFCSAVVVVTSCENIIMYWLEMAIFSGKIEITSQPTTPAQGENKNFPSKRHWNEIILPCLWEMALVLPGAAGSNSPYYPLYPEHTNSEIFFPWHLQLSYMCFWQARRMMNIILFSHEYKCYNITFLFTQLC